MKSAYGRRLKHVTQAQHHHPLSSVRKRDEGRGCRCRRCGRNSGCWWRASGSEARRVGRAKRLGAEAASASKYERLHHAQIQVQRPCPKNVLRPRVPLPVPPGLKAAARRRGVGEEAGDRQLVERCVAAGSPAGRRRCWFRRGSDSGDRPVVGETVRVGVIA